jgi:hypothetical protein
MKLRNLLPLDIQETAENGYLLIESVLLEEGVEELAL